MDLQIDEIDSQRFINQVHKAVNESSIKAVFVDDCAVLKEDFLQETLESVV